MPSPRTLRIQSPSVIQLTEGDGNTKTGIHLTKLGRYQHPTYGVFEITQQFFDEMIRNFEAGTFGQKIFVDIAHNPDNGAGAEIVRLYQDGQWLKCDLEITPFGRDAILTKKYIYLSADYDERWTNPATGQHCGCTLKGAGLTIRPFVKGQPGIQLAEPTLIHEGNNAMNEFLKLLRDAYATRKLSEDVQTPLITAFEATAKTLSEDNKPALQALVDEYITLGDAVNKQLAEQSPKDRMVNISIGMTETQVRHLMETERKQLAEQTANTAKQLSDNKAAFQTALDAATGLSDDTKRTLAEAAELITADMSADQVKRLAEFQIAQGNKLEVTRQLSGMGYHVAGNPHITVDDTNSLKRLQEEVDKRLGLSNQPDMLRFKSTGGKLEAANKTLAENVLAQYDRNHAKQLMHESKQLADAGSSISDVSVPAAFERTVLREALYNLVGLQFVNSGTAEFGESLYLPYSYRKNSAAGVADTRVYEGGSIQRAGVVQTGETAYPIPQKLSFEVSDELRYLTSTNRLNWEAVSENQANASRIIGEDTDRIIFNEHVRASDEYQTIAVANENLATQISGGKKVALVGGATVTTVCRPRKTYNLQGAQINNTQNPVVVTYNGAVRAEYGTSTADGIYYVLDYDIGEVYMVDEAGVLQDPAGKAWTISYSRVTNVGHFDTAVPNGVKIKEHWDTFLRLFGLRKSLIEDTRYYMANFGLMSGNAMNEIEQAEKFAANFKVPGTDLASSGNLGMIKSVPNYKTSAPNLWIGDRRVVIGERNVTRLRITKPWTMGQLENQKDANGRFTGQKEAYGDQFLILHTPTQLKAALTSIVMYHAPSRVARVAP